MYQKKNSFNGELERTHRWWHSNYFW